jgi:uncharacterized Zn finger protein (UPF0148 family)
MDIKEMYDLLGDWIDESCPNCKSQLLGNKVGDKWCSLVGCEYREDTEVIEVG